MIPANRRYIIHNHEFFGCVKTFKTWRYYLKHYKYQVFILTDHNNLYEFMNIKTQSLY